MIEMLLFFFFFLNERDYLSFSAAGSSPSKQNEKTVPNNNETGERRLGNKQGQVHSALVGARASHFASRLKLAAGAVWQRRGAIGYRRAVAI